LKYLAIIFFVFFFNACRHREEKDVTQFPGKPVAPASILKEHEYLLSRIHGIASYKDSTGRAAQKLLELMQHHFTEEEDYVLPTLGLLPILTSDSLPENIDDIIKLTDKLESNTTHLNVEHQMIRAYMQETIQAAAFDKHPEIIEIEKVLRQHASLEEEILFPTALMIGRYLKLKSR